MAKRVILGLNLWRRPILVRVLHYARATIEDHARQTELLPLSRLAAERGVHVRILQAAARAAVPHPGSWP